VQSHIPAIAIVFNDNAYGNVLRAQTEQFDGRVIGTRLHNPNFAQFASLFGARGAVASNAADLEAALREAVVESPKLGLPTIIEVAVGPMQREF
jgi:acetolactate synthase-1/2/3 large subunit